MRHPHDRCAFTLVELLVVITIIVVLLAMLAPALDKAIEAAGRAVCAANLHHWGAAHGLYYMDNKRKLMTQARIYNDAQNNQDGWVYPHHAWIWDDARFPGQFSAQAYAPYGLMSYSSVPTRGQAARTPTGQTASTHGPGTGASLSKLWLCPSDPRYKEMGDRNNNEAQKPPGPTKATGDFARDVGGPYIDGHYAYFGRVSDWAIAGAGSVNNTGAGSVRAPWPDELVDNSLGGARLFMNCKVKRDNGTWGAPAFSHREVVEESLLNLLGTNQLYADGSAAWFDHRYFNVAYTNSHPFDTGPATDPDLPHYINANGTYGSAQPYYFYATTIR
jgi:prepilin-type N-terminal cleavage/methylation domain-containing protein